MADTHPVRVAAARRRLIVFSCPSSDPAFPVLVAAAVAVSMWTPILIAAGGCYALKLAGLSVPRRLLDGPPAASRALPVALLAALIATQTFAGGLDARAAGSPPPRSPSLARAPFLVVVAAAAATTALLRLLTRNADRRRAYSSRCARSSWMLWLAPARRTISTSGCEAAQPRLVLAA